RRLQLHLPSTYVVELLENLRAQRSRPTGPQSREDFLRDAAAPVVPPILGVEQHIRVDEREVNPHDAATGQCARRRSPRGSIRASSCPVPGLRPLHAPPL